MMQKREANFGKKNYEPVDSIDHLYPGTFYLAKVDDKFRRYYRIKGADQSDIDREKFFNWSGALQG